MSLSLSPSVLVAEDQQLLRLGLRVTLENLKCCRILGEVENGEAAVRETQRLRPDIVLMDIGLPGIDGIEATWRIKKELPRTRVVMFTSRTSQDCVTAALGAGADGYCSKDAPAELIANAINAVLSGQVWLDPAIASAMSRIRRVEDQSNVTGSSDMEIEILALIQQGMDNLQIAARLNTTTERIAAIMHSIIDRYVAKTTKGPNEASQSGSSNEWFTALVENQNEGRVISEKYLLGDLLGYGATGAVFKAKHLYMNRSVALKLMRPEFSEDRLVMRHFQREAESIAKMQHKNVVDVHDLGFSEEGEPYLVMEYINGSNLADILKTTHRLPVRRAINICLQVSAGLAEAHSKGIIHCDLKPSNILILGSEPGETVKLVDFGLAQLVPLNASTQSQLTDQFFVSGTPLYMSPEQCTGTALDTRSDIYSLGCMLHEALTGVNVFEGVTAMETFAKHLQLIPPPLSSTHPGLCSAQLDACISKMLAKDPAARPQSMTEVMMMLFSCTESVSR